MMIQGGYGMIYGTIHSTGKMLELTQKWEQKKESGNLIKKEIDTMSAEKQQLQMFKERLEKEREGNEYSAIYAKMQSGQELSPAEEDKLRQHDPKAYMEYKADRMEQETYEKRLRNCKTKEEAEKLHINRINGKLSELKSIINNANIPKDEKLKEAQRILGETTRTAEIFHAFAKSEEFKELPTEIESKVEYEKLIESTEYVSSDSEMITENRQDNVAETEQKLLEEMYELEEKHFGEQKKTVRIDVRL